MLFNSIEFFIFFPIVVIAYFTLPQRFRWQLLLLASTIFYVSYIPIYSLVLFFTLVVDYFSGILIADAATPRRKRLYLFLSVACAISVLFTFKYFNFFNANVASLAQFLGWNYSIKSLQLLLPVGISFYTFQSMSYVIDVYRGTQKAERHFGIYALYVLFFPQLVAGPIERSQNLLPQFYEMHEFDYNRVVMGLKMMCWGLFKKVVIADRLAILVNTVYNTPTDYTGIPLMLATIFFAFQIFCDFSGYSDIAVGSAEVMGFRIMRNFQRPYFSRSISEFWSRWHISLSTWFKDYLYIPLGGNRVSVSRWYLNLFLVFLISGFWHGANWTFLIWGASHGIYLISALLMVGYWKRLVSFIRLDRMPQLYRWLEIAMVFILVDFSWIFFRANSLSDAVYIITHLFVGWDLSIFGKIDLGGFDRVHFIIAFMSISLMELVHYLQEFRQLSLRMYIARKALFYRWVSYILLCIAIIFLGEKGLQFIYFQF